MEAQSNIQPAELMAKPVFSFTEFWEGLLNLSKSTGEKITQDGNGPKIFMIGRHRFIRKQDALDWIDQQTETRPYFPRKNNKRNGVTT